MAAATLQLKKRKRENIMSDLCALFAVVIEMDESYSEWMTIDVFWHVQLQCTKDNTNRAEQPTKSDIQREKPIITAIQMVEYQIRCEKWTSANPNQKKVKNGFQKRVTSSFVVRVLLFEDFVFRFISLLFSSAVALHKMNWMTRAPKRLLALNFNFVIIIIIIGVIIAVVNITIKYQITT